MQRTQITSDNEMSNHVNDKKSIKTENIQENGPKKIKFHGSRRFEVTILGSTSAKAYENELQLNNSYHASPSRLNGRRNADFKSEVTTKSQSFRNAEKRNDKNVNHILLNHDFQPDARNNNNNNNNEKKDLENLKISSILKNLLVSTDDRYNFTLCKQLEYAVRHPSNAAYIRRSFDFIYKNLMTVLKQCNEDWSDMLAYVLGIIGYINLSNFTQFSANLFKEYEKKQIGQKHITIALRSFISCDANNYRLSKHCDFLLQNLKTFLENTENAEIFMSICDSITELSNSYNPIFDRHFKDIVDIVVGWHLETEQSSDLKHHCSATLQKLSLFFLKHLDFSLGLLGQFLEDITGFGDDIVVADSSKEKQQNVEKRTGAFIGAFNTIVKCLISNSDMYKIQDTLKTLILEGYRIIQRVAIQIFKMNIASEEIILSANDFLTLIYEKFPDLSLLLNTYEFIEAEMEIFHDFNDLEARSLLFLIYHICKQMKTNLPLKLVTLILKRSNNPFVHIKLATNQRTRYLLLKIYQEILMIKNVPLLQEAYSHISKDIDISIKKLKNENERNDIPQAEANLVFYLAALTPLATQTSSIIIMYALSPSLLELFVHHYKASDMDLWSQYATVHQVLLDLLITHCQKNNNFRTTSLLLNEQEANSSPTSEYFTILLQFLADVLKQASQLGKSSLISLLTWLQSLLEDCRFNYEVLAKNSVFSHICKSLADLCPQSPLEIACCLKTILNYKRLPSDTMENIRKACFPMLDSQDTRIQEVYADIFSLLPLSISLNNSSIEYYDLLTKNQQQYNASDKFVSLKPKFFKMFLDYLDPNNNDVLDINTFNDQNVRFLRQSWLSNLNDGVTKYMETAQTSLHLASSWLQFEAARYCVQNKLKTIIGKPQETFLAIEAIILKYAKILTTKPDSSDADACSLAPPNNSFKYKLFNQMRCRMLLGFVEHLEKLIYNAVEGTAYGLAPAEKAAKTFFRVNAPTCNEWFKRIRNAVCVIASQCMEPELIIRYCQTVLVLEKLPDPTMDHYLLKLVSALLSCGESDTLLGLYMHLKHHSENRYQWIQFVADQAAFKKESAIDGYENYLREHPDIEVSLKNFLCEQLVNCYSSTGQWTSLKSIINETEDLSISKYDYTNLGKLEKYFQQYAEFNQINDNGDIFVKLAQWSLDERQHQGHGGRLSGSDNGSPFVQNNQSFSIFNILQQLENDNFMLNYNIISQCRETKNSILNLGFIESLYHSWHDECKEFIILNHIKNFETFSSILKEDVSSINADSTTLLKYLYWSLKAHEKQNSLLPENFDLTSILFLNTAVSAREEGNIKLAFYILEQFLKYKGYAGMWQEKMIINVADPQLVKGCIETSKLFNLQPAKNLNDTLALLAEVARQAIAYIYPTNSNHTDSVASEVLINMAENITLRPVNTIIDIEQMDDLIASLPVDQIKSNSIVNTIMPAPDFIAGKFLNASILYDPQKSEAWYAFGNWCYRWGKKIVEPNTIDSQYGKWSQQDLEQIKTLFDQAGETLNAKDLGQLLAVLNKHHLQYGESLEDDSSETNSGEDLERKLRDLSFISDKPSELVSNIIKIWHRAQNYIYSYYEIATRAYFRYLSLKTAEFSSNNPSTTCNENLTEDSSFVTTTLRLLRLIVKHAVGLQEVIEEGLSTTPLRPWKIIIPQLFSRLNHHEPYVRKCVSELLCRLASLHSHLIIFPAVVGAQQHQEHQANSETSKRLAFCFNDLLQNLMAQAPDTVNHVKLLVKELKRITLLWEEHWLHSLAQLYSDYSPLVNSLENEVKKNKSVNMEKVEAKYQVLTAHIIQDLEKLQAVTNRYTETNYEKAFQDRFNPYINETIDNFRKPFQQDKIMETWQTIKKLYGLFQHKSVRGSNYILKITELSPVLARMSKTAIAMPGIDTNEQIYIHAVDPYIHILPTKTKPKKLAFYGSNGKKYTYLFKGLEDLHLDERIMQFLSISNSMMAKSTETKNVFSKPLFKAKHYSVIPLGPQSGLISWVEGVTPIFALYKKWQQREALIRQQQKEKANAAKAPTTNSGDKNPNQQQQQQQQQQLQQPTVVPQFSVTPVATRPTELFYQKLSPLLAEQNMKVSDPRKQWPLPILKQVFKELSQETPKDLIAKELWCHSINASEWRKSIRNYSMSMAVMSVIGYIIGLGDRHLDNVLINLASGEIVHIDYNVCFEKGKSLRIPEKVPFRMTQNLETALGITGVEGAFRLGCEHVLKILRKEKETLLTLLEAFVYDPLVDWTTGDESISNVTGITKSTTAHVAADEINKINLSFSSKNGINSNKDLMKMNQLNYAQKKPDMELAKQNIMLRFHDIKPLWRQYLIDLEYEFEDIIDIINNVKRIRKTIAENEERRDNITKEMSFVHDVKYLGKAIESHSLNTISERYANYKKHSEAFEYSVKNIQQHRDNIEHFLTNYYNEIVSDDAHAKFQFLQMNLNAEQQRQIPDEFQDLLTLAGCNAAEAEHGQSVRREITNMLERETVSLLETFDMLMQYSDVMMYYPRHLLKKNPLMVYKNAYNQILTDKVDANFENQVFYEQCKSYSPTLDSLAAINYANALLKYRQEFGFLLQKALNDLKEHKQQMLIPMEVAVEDVQCFINSASDTMLIELKFYAMCIITKSHESSQLYEMNFNGLNGTAIDRFDLLDQQSDYLNSLRNMLTLIFPYLIDVTEINAFALFTDFQEFLDSLLKLKNAFLLPIPERVFKLYMLDDDEELQENLKQLNYATYLQNMNFQQQHIDNQISNHLLATILKDLLALFTDVEAKLQRFWQSAEANPMFNLFFPKTFKAFGFISNLKFEIIANLFSLMYKYTSAFKEQHLDMFYDPRCIVSLIEDYIKCLLENHFNSVISLLITAFNSNLENSAALNVLNMDGGGGGGAGDDVGVNLQIQSICENLFLAEKQSAQFNQHQRHVLRYTKWLDHITLISTAHNWINIKYLNDTQYLFPHITFKSSLLHKLYNNTQILSQWKQALVAKQTEIETLTTGLEKLLQTDLMTAINQNDSNHDLKRIHEKFITNSSMQKQHCIAHVELLDKLVDYSMTLLQFEKFSIYGEAKDEEKIFENLLNEYKATKRNLNESLNEMTAMEKSLVELLDPEGAIDLVWLENVKGLLDEMLHNAQKLLADLENDELDELQRLVKKTRRIEDLMEHSARADVRYLLKSVFRNEKTTRVMNEDALDIPANSVLLRDFRQNFKNFFAIMAEVRVKIASATLNTEGLEDIYEMISQLKAMAQQKYDAFTEAIQSFADSGSLGETASPSGTLSDTTMKLQNIGEEQKRNIYGVSVWKRVRIKLEGRDPDTMRRSSVAEQVDYIIKESSNIDNLAVLYEGWTPWV